MKRNRRRHVNAPAGHLAACRMHVAIRRALAGSLVLASTSVLFGSFSVYAQLPQPCGGAACAPQGGPSQWVTHGAASANLDGTTLNIHQSSERATLNWQSFDIGTGHAVRFHQPDATSVALNRIHQADPSLIQGALSANGQVYLLNKNGIVFGDGAQIDVHSLVATTLDIDEELFRNGTWLGAFNVDGRAALNSDGRQYVLDRDGQVILYRVNDAGEFIRGGDGRLIRDEGGRPFPVMIDVASDAAIRANKSGAGRVLLAAPKVVNAGTIDAPKGEIIAVAASDKVYLKPDKKDGVTQGHILVEVDTGGDVSNLGSMLAEQGNVSIVGHAVNQQGRVRATTSVQLGGMVRLLARDKASAVTGTGDTDIPLVPSQGGTLTLGENSVTEVVAHRDGHVAVDGTPQPVSRIELAGKDITVEKNATLRATGGEIRFAATATGSNPNLASIEANNLALTPGEGTLRLHAGSVVDVSGDRSGVLPMERNIVTVELRGNELKDSPLQRDGALRKQRVRVDVRKGTPLADISGAVENIQRDVSERLAAGGTIEMLAQDIVVVDEGVTLDFSGGQVAYEAGVIATSKLLSDGRLIDIADADPNRTYDGVFGSYTETDPRWGTHQTWESPTLLAATGRYEEGYVQGKDAGHLIIATHGLHMDAGARVNGQAGAGRLQRNKTDLSIGWNGNRPYDQAPRGGELSLGFVKGDARLLDEGNARLPDIMFGVLPVESAGDVVVLAPDLFARAGVGTARVYSKGKITLPAGTEVAAAAAAQLTLDALDFEVGGSLRTVGGSITLKTAKDGEGAISIGPAATLSTRGNWVNDLPLHNPGGAMAPLWIDGGNVTLTAAGDLAVAAGALIDVGGGGWVQRSGSLRGGAGGSISLTSQLGSLADRRTMFDVQATLRADSLSAAGSLNLAAGAFCIGGAACGPVDASDAAIGRLVVGNEFFRRTSFSRYGLTANFGEMRVASDANIELKMTNLTVDANYGDYVTGSNIDTFSHLVILPDSTRKPVSIELMKTHKAAPLNLYAPAPLVVEAGARVATDPGANITIAAHDRVEIAGRLDAPGGTITVSSAPPSLAVSSDSLFLPNHGIWLDSQARLDASAALVPLDNELGLHQGRLLAGGRIVINATQGYFSAARGSLLDVSGMQADFDSVRTASANGTQVRRETVTVPAGVIDLSASEGMLLDGTLQAVSAPESGAQGGTLRVAIDADYPHRPGVGAQPQAYASYNWTPRRIELLNPAEAPMPTDVLAPGAGPVNADFTAKYNGRVLLPVSAITNGGFDSVSLRAGVYDDTREVGQSVLGQVIFSGNIDLALERDITIDAAEILVDAGDANVSAASVSLANESPLSASAPTAGTGSLTVNAGGIDLRNRIVISGVRSVELNSADDIRLDQTLDAAGYLIAPGTLSLQADQIYPTTASHFRLQATDILDANGEPAAPALAGRIVTRAGDAPGELLLAAAGSVQVDASHIEHGGVVRAPFGSVQLGSDTTETLTLEANSVVSTSGSGSLIPYGYTRGELFWNYVQQGNSSAVTAVNTAPAQGVQLNARALTMADGARIDIRGGGDLLAVEFVAGPFGSRDLLDATVSPSSFAIVPALSGDNARAPIDDYYGAGFTGPRDGQIEIGDNNSGLPAGRYAILPPRYAALPGAFLVSPVAGRSGAMQQGDQYTLLGGTPVVAGRRRVSGTTIADSQWAGYIVEDPATINQRAEYRTSTANAFFTPESEENSSAALPRDAGQLLISAEGRLTLDGSVASAADSGGRGGRVDIEGLRIAVTDARTVNDYASDDTSETGYVVLDADGLNGLGADSLLIGGRRELSGEGVVLRATATEVVIADGVNLHGTEILLAAQQTETQVDSGTPAEAPTRAAITVSEGAHVEAVGTRDAAVDALTVEGEGALLRVSASPQAEFERTGAQAGTGILDIRRGAVVSAQGSSVLDASGDIRLDGSVTMERGALRLGASTVRLGAASPVGQPQANGLTLSRETLDALKVDELALVAPQGIELHGDLNLTFRRLEFDSAQVRGVSAPPNAADAPSQQIVLQTDSFSFGSSFAAGEPAMPAADNIDLTLTAREVEWEAGNYGFNGFKSVNLHASDSWRFVGDGALAVSGAWNSSAPLYQAVHGVDFSLNAVGAASFGRSGAPVVAQPNVSTIDSVPDTGLGARFTLAAKTIDVGGHLLFPSGAVSLTGEQGVTVSGAAEIDVAGRVMTLRDGAIYSPGGHVGINSGAGSVILQEGAKINVSAALDDAGAALGGDAGGLFIDGAGAAELNATLIGASHADYRSGQFRVTAERLNDFAALQNKLRDGGFTEEVAVRVRQGDLTVAADTTLRAHEIALAADTGHVQINGVLDASGARGGTVTLDAGVSVDVNAGARINAAATDAEGRGGRVELGAAKNGTLRIAEGATIDVRGAPIVVPVAEKVTHPLLPGEFWVTRFANGEPVLQSLDSGSVVLRAPQRSTDPALAGQMHEVAVETFAAQVLGAVPRLEAYRVYDVSAGETLPEMTAVDSLWNQDAVGFSQHAAAISARLGGRPLVIQPGIELNINGDWTLAQDWDLSTWRFNGTQPGTLTVRAQGAVNFAGSLSDGFDLPGVDSSGSILMTERLRGDESWRYRLVAGADLSAANPMATATPTAHSTLTTAQDMTLGEGVRVRTGTGAIDVAASGDLRFVAPDSESQPSTGNAALYTAGRSAGNGSYDPVLTAGADGIPPPFAGDHPVAGGALRIVTGGDIEGGDLKQLPMHWLHRIGSAKENITGTAPEIGNPTAMSIRFDLFRQGVGAFGGGDVSLRAGGDVNGLGVALPANLMQVGAAPDLDDDAVFGEGLLSGNNRVLTLGQGDLVIDAGQDIQGGAFYVAKGTGRIHSNGKIGGSADGTAIAPVLALADSQFTVHARSDAEIAMGINPTIAPSSGEMADSGGQLAYFATYSESAAISLASSGGDVVVPLRNALDVMANKFGLLYGNNNVTSGELRVLPPNLRLWSFSGDIVSGADSSAQAPLLFPSSHGQAEWIANGSVRQLNPDMAQAVVKLNVSDAEINRIPTTLNSSIPNELASGIHTLLDPESQIFFDGTPIHTSDALPLRIIALHGDLALLVLNSPKSASLYAGRDIVGLKFTGQHLNNTDVSEIIAGRDIVNPIAQDANGAITSVGAGGQIDLHGPGRLDVVAGRDLDLGTGAGVRTLGNLAKPALPENGASVVAMSGQARAMNLREFAKAYYDTNALGVTATHRDFFLTTIAAMTGRTDLSIESALSLFFAMPESLQRGVVLTTLFSELAQAGNAETGGTKRGYDALATLFPLPDDNGAPPSAERYRAAYPGDMTLFFSTLQTQDGGDINVIVPGGFVNAGLAQSNLGAAKGPEALGIVALRQGSIRMAVLDDVAVNQSRIQALDGGDLLVWSSYGDIDAGRGEKTALSAPPARRDFDQAFNRILNVPPAVAGSGIRAGVTTPGRAPGELTLLAPEGVVDAGDAGIFSAGDITIVAVEVRGADNIEVGGVAEGVPVSDAGAMAGALSDAGGAASSASKDAESALSKNIGDEADSSTPLADDALSFLEVVVEGFGSGDSVADEDSEDDEEEKKRGNE